MLGYNKIGENEDEICTYLGTTYLSASLTQMANYFPFALVRTTVICAAQKAPHGLLETSSFLA